MVQKKRIEPKEAVEDHGGVFEVAMGSTPFVPVMAEYSDKVYSKDGNLLS